MAAVRGYGIWISLLVCAIIVLAVGCGPVPRVHPVTAGAGTRASTAAVRANPPLAAILDAPFGASPNSLRLVGLDGTEAASIVLRGDAEAIAVAGPRVLIAGGGRLNAVDRSGGDTELGTIPDDTADDLLRGLVASPDGSQWLWSSIRSMPDGSVRSRIYVDDDVAGPRLVLERTEQGHALQPVAWTTGGPVLSDELDGIGGYVLFRRSFGATGLLDIATATLTPMTGDSCAFSDLAADGATACVVDGREGPNDGGPLRLTVQRAAGSSFSVRVAPGMRQAGAALFEPGGSLVSLSSSPALGDVTETERTGFVDAHTGALQAITFNGLQPMQWISSSSLLMTRGLNITGGPPGTYVARLDGTTTPVSPHPYAIGVVR